MFVKMIIHMGIYTYSFLISLLKYLTKVVSIILNKYPNNTKREDGSCSKPEVEVDVVSCGECNATSGINEWSEWLDTTNPSVVGEWETVNSMMRFKICDNPSGIEARRTDPSSADALITHVDPLYGFWCSNHEQVNNTVCPNFEVRFCCPSEQLNGDEADQCEIPNSGWAWTQWFNRDDPSDTGDWELITSFSDVDICQYPRAIKAQSSGPQQYTHIDLEKGFWCINSENEQGCNDYEVSYCCPAPKESADGEVTIIEGTCEGDNYVWSDWLNGDDPVSGMGDIEHTRHFARHKVCQDS